MNWIVSNFLVISHFFPNNMSIFPTHMNRRFTALLLSLSACSAFAGESVISMTYQPLNGLALANIKIVPVACHDWHAHSGGIRSIGLISAKNVPPTNNEREATYDLNLASICSIHFSTNDIGAADPPPLEITMDLSEFSVPKNLSQKREDIIRASLECLRLCIPDKSKKVPLILECNEADKPWLAPIVAEFNKHDLNKVFFKPE
jgi:hypothetical protein